MKIVFNVVLGILYIFTGSLVLHSNSGNRIVGRHDDEYSDSVSGITLIFMGISLLWVAIQ